MDDRYATLSGGLDSPATHGFAAVPSDTQALPEVTRAVYVGTAGTLVAIMASGQQLVFAGVPGGTLLPLRVRRIAATGTTAGAILGLV